MSKREVLRSMKAWRKYGQEYLEAKGIEDARTDAWLLLEFVCNITKSFYYLHMNDSMDAADALEYQKLIQSRGTHIPVQHLIGEAWFFGQPFRVNEHVLIPRQDTEILVEEALRYLKPGMRILDLCTGSGCILLTLVRHAFVTGVGSDISEEALQVARKNGMLQKLEGYTFIQSDMFEKIEGVFDMIVSNPPYIASSVIPALMEEVREHEPVLALDGHEDGLHFYRIITEQAKRYLKPGGWLCMEIGYDQAGALKGLMGEQGYTSIEIRKDLADLSRVASAQWQPQ